MSLDPIWGLFATRLRAILPFLRRELGVPWFPPGRIERQLTAHGEGGMFGAHVDNGEMSLAGRRITGVYYVHRVPKRFSGGELRVYDRASSHGYAVSAPTYQVIDCVNNRAVFFASDTPHEVRPVHNGGTSFENSRFAMNAWFWSGTRVSRPEGKD